jgi:hypothetical protein
MTFLRSDRRLGAFRPVLGPRLRREPVRTRQRECSLTCLGVRRLENDVVPPRDVRVALHRDVEARDGPVA